MDDLEFGSALVSRGLLSEDELREAIWERDRLQRLGTVPPFLWDILIKKGYLSRVQVDEVLASMQKRSRFCAACNLVVTVPRITPEGERCGRCGGPVSWRDVGAQSIPHDTMMLLTGDLPKDVTIAKTDPSRVLGKYVLVEEAGRGGAGVVYKAWDLVLRQYVALKLIRKLESKHISREELIKDLLKEARSAIRLRHPNIVPVFDAGRFGDEFFMCMEYVEGDSLAAHIRSAHARGRISPLYEDPVRYLEIMRDVALAIHYAHTFPKPIIHCDLKPGNVLLDTECHAFLVDFGLAQPADLPDTPDGEGKGIVRGTPAYMAPEQLTGRVEDIGPWTDIYALGAILYELMTGRQVFQGTAFEILSKAVNDPPPSPLGIVAKSGEANREDSTTVLLHGTRLEAISLQCLQKDRAKRPQSAGLVADDIERILGAMRTRFAARAPQPLPQPVPQAARSPQPGAVEEGMTRFDLEAAFKEIGEPQAAWDAGDPAAIATDRGRQLKCVEAFKDRMIERINKQRPKIDKLDLLDHTVHGVELLRATRKMVVAFERGQSVELVWAAMQPLQLVSLAVDILKLDQPADRLALGLYGLTAGLHEIGRQFLVSLSGTPLEPAGAAILERLPKS